jgi:hypothetical protein
VHSEEPTLEENLPGEHVWQVLFAPTTVPGWQAVQLLPQSLHWDAP